MHVLEEAWMEALKSEEAKDLVEEIMDLIFFGLREFEDREEANRLLKELEELGELEAVHFLAEKLKNKK